jgi:DNA-directed RNA polymerase subunit RPC12/RpoP
MDDPLIWLVGAGVVAALAVGAYLFVRSRRTPRAEPYLHFRCPVCKRRIRFRASQAGHNGRCSHCGGKLTFPPASQSID